jgi:hypothetical protein
MQLKKLTRSATVQLVAHFHCKEIKTFSVPLRFTRYNLCRMVKPSHSIMILGFIQLAIPVIKFLLYLMFYLYCFDTQLSYII